MPTVWNLRLPMVGDGDLERCRLIYEQLLTDVAVDRLVIEEQLHDPFVRSMSITFKEGYEHPTSPTLRFLPQQYPADRTPVRSLLALNQEVADMTRAIVNGLRVPEELLDPDRFASIDRIHNPCAEIPLRPEPLKLDEIPKWLKPGIWVDCNGSFYRVQRLDVMGDGIPYVVLRQPPPAPPTDLAFMLFRDFATRLKFASGPPPVLRTWHDRILDDD